MSNQDNKQEKKNSKILNFLDILKSVLISLIVAFIVICFIRLSIVNGESMESTLHDRDKLILTRIDRTPTYNDIIVATPEGINVDYIIKRVIGLPGDTIEIKDNLIYVNDIAIDEPYVKEKMITADIKKFTLSNDEYFVCGDNRNNSLDSRSSILGPIHQKDIYGKIIINLSQFKIY